MPPSSSPGTLRCTNKSMQVESRAQINNHGRASELMLQYPALQMMALLFQTIVPRGQMRSPILTQSQNPYWKLSLSSRYKPGSVQWGWCRSVLPGGAGGTPLSGRLVMVRSPRWSAWWPPPWPVYWEAGSWTRHFFRCARI